MNLDVRIKTTAEGQGAQQAADGLKKAADNADLLKAKLAQAAQTNASLTAESDKVTKSARQSAEVFKELFKAQEEQEKAVEKYDQVVQSVTKSQDRWAISKREAIGALKKLRESIPGLGYVIDALRNPYAAITAIIATFVVQIAKQIEKQRELERAALDMGRALDTSRNAMDRAKGDFTGLEEAADSYLQKMREIADQEHGIDATASRQMRGIERQSEIDIRREQASLSAGERTIDAQVAQGKMTPAAGEAAKKRLREESAGRVEGIKSGADKRKFDVLQEATLQRAEQAAQAESALPSATAEAQRLADRAAKAKAGAPGLQAAAEAELAKVNEEIAEAEEEAANRGTGRFMTGLIPFSNAEIEAAQGRVVSLQRQKANIESRIAGIQQQPGKAQRAADAAAARVRSLQDQSIAARRGVVGFEQKAQDARADIEQAGNLQAALAPLVNQENAANAIIEALRIKEEADKARDKAIIDALQRMGFNAKRAKAAVEAENGR